MGRHLELQEILCMKNKISMSSMLTLPQRHMQHVVTDSCCCRLLKQSPSNVLQLMQPVVQALCCCSATRSSHLISNRCGSLQCKTHQACMLQSCVTVGSRLGSVTVGTRPSLPDVQFLRHLSENRGIATRAGSQHTSAGGGF